MTEQRPYTYTVLRYVHDARAGEMLNVGVVLHVAAEHRLLVKTRDTHGRVKRAFPDLDGDAFRGAMRSVERAVGAVAEHLAATTLLAHEGDAASLARKAMAADDSALQWSPVGSGLTGDAEATLARLFERLVLRNDDRTAPRRRVDEEVWRPIRDKLVERNVHVPFEQKVISGTVCGCLKCQQEWERSLPPETPMSERWAGPGRKGWRYACEVCGNKRCPHHSDHRLACTASNRPGQPGSIYA